jgi:hypothetical protein
MNFKHVGYEKSCEAKLIRLTHRVTSKTGMHALGLKDALEAVPNGARISDFYINDDCDMFCIEFTEEREKNNES